ncbi:heparan-alpha-glucosaminide N-acetyltransferase [Hoeflea prorocentri]
MGTARPASQRLVLIDVARGLALLAMAIYHFTWDLEFFGYAPPGMTTQGGWRLFARLIAGSFLFLVGVSLVLAHRKSIRWRPFGMRLAMVAGAALIITAATRIAMPDRFIFFGILHCIAVSSVLGLAFLRLPALLTAAIGVAVILAPPYLASTAFSHGPLLWLGLSVFPVHSNDYVPLFPWFGPVLIGIATTRIAISQNWLETIASLGGGKNPLGKPLSFAGRHSLALYLIHQPVLIGSVYLASLAFPVNQLTSITNNCVLSCAQNNSADFCERFCDCTVKRLAEEDLLETLQTSGNNVGLTPGVQEIVDQCTASTLEANQAE